jgi:ribosomal protein S5
LDISAKVWGSRNPMNVIKATFEALGQKQKLPEDIARGRGKRVVDVQHTYYGASE